MSKSTNTDSVSPPKSNFKSTNTRTTTWFFAIFAPVVVAFVIYRLDPFEPVHLPVIELNKSMFAATARNENMRQGSEALAEGHVVGPEDLVYDAANGVVYTGCEDGWIKRVTVNESVADSVVENWVNTGGRPLGLAFDRNGALIVADAYKVLLIVIPSTPHLGFCFLFS